jgi:hypothetical protein
LNIKIRPGDKIDTNCHRQATKSVPDTFNLKTETYGEQACEQKPKGHK